MICCALGLTIVATWVIRWRSLKKKVGRYEEPALEEEYVAEVRDDARV